MINIGVIGTAFRRDDNNKLNIVLINKIKNLIYETINKITFGKVTLVSGAAAGIDSLAIDLFLDGLVNKLILHLPTIYDFNNKRYITTSTGNIANYYHHQFSNKCYSRDDVSLKAINAAKIKGAELVVCEHGFLARDRLIARDSEFLIVSTFGKGAYVKPGGSHHTTKEFLKIHDSNKSFHLNLNDFVAYNPAKVI